MACVTSIAFIVPIQEDGASGCEPRSELTQSTLRACCGDHGQRDQIQRGAD
jgi:hypothetical protein